MFNPKIFIPATLALIGIGVYWFSVLSSEVALMAMYPEIDQKIVIKAHRIMVRRTLAGRYGTDITNSDDALAMVFEEIVKEITSK